METGEEPKPRVFQEAEASVAKAENRWLNPLYPPTAVRLLRETIRGIGRFFKHYPFEAEFILGAGLCELVLLSHGLLPALAGTVLLGAGFGLGSIVAARIFRK